jgi:uncharacterized protein YjbJ (UPF0337 family)
MNWDRIEGKWKQLRGRMKQKWGDITDDQWYVADGKRCRRAGEVQEAYGIGKDQAKRMLRDWKRRSNRSASL